MPVVRCKGIVRSTGEQCKNRPIPGAFVCRYHGGNDDARRNGAKRLAVQRAEKVLIEALAEAPAMHSVGDVYDDLLQVAGVASTWRQILQDRVAELQKLGYRGVTAEQVKADVQLFERALDRSAKIGESIARLNLEERKQALDERTAGMVATCIRAVLDDLDLTPEQKAVATVAAPRRLRELTA